MITDANKEAAAKLISEFMQSNDNIAGIMLVMIDRDASADVPWSATAAITRGGEAGVMKYPFRLAQAMGNAWLSQVGEVTKITDSIDEYMQEQAAQLRSMMNAQNTPGDTDGK